MSISFELDFDYNYDSTEFMFFDVEYFDDNYALRQNNFCKTTYFPIQFTLINYFGRICINEWIFYSINDLNEQIYNCYLKALSSRGVIIDATCNSRNVEGKIKMYMTRSKYMVGYGCETDVNRMYDVLNIKLLSFSMLDLSLCDIFCKQGGSSESLRNNVRRILFRSIHDKNIRHDSRSDAQLIRALFLEKEDYIITKIQEIKFKLKTFNK